MTMTLPAAREGKPAWLPVAPYVFVTVWSMGYVMATIGQTSAAPITLLALRYLTCVVLLLPLVPLHGVTFPTDPRRIAGIALTGFLIHVVYFGTSYLALHQGMSVAVITLVLSLQPMLTALLAPWFTRERVTARIWGGLALGLAGVTIVVLARSEVGSFPPSAIVLALVSLLGFSLGTLVDKRVGAGHHLVAANVIQFVVGSLFCVPIAIAFEGFAFTVTPELVMAVAYLSIGNSLFALSLLLAMGRYGEVSRVSSLLYLIPPVASIFAWIVLGQPIPPVLWIGMAIASAGVWLAMRPSPPRPKRPPTP